MALAFMIAGSVTAGFVILVMAAMLVELRRFARAQTAELRKSMTRRNELADELATAHGIIASLEGTIAYLRERFGTVAAANDALGAAGLPTRKAPSRDPDPTVPIARVLTGPGPAPDDPSDGRRSRPLGTCRYPDRTHIRDRRSS